MREDEFRFWLSNDRGYGDRTVGSRISNCRTVERYEGDLDRHFERDRLRTLIERLAYSSKDHVSNRIARHKVPIDGNIYTGSATLKSAVSLYKQFCEQGNEETEILPGTATRPPGLVASRHNIRRADFRGFFLQFIEEKALHRSSVFTEAELVTWFKGAHPDRTPPNIHDQLLKKSTNYPDRIRFVPAPSQLDDLFFALDPAFQTFRLYRVNEDPPPIYKEARLKANQLQSEEKPSASRPDRPSVRNGLLLSTGSVLQNRYRIVRHLAAGGMGAVYEAVDQRLNSVVALKETLCGTPEMSRAFEREASLLANLQHPALPVVIDHFLDSAGQFLVMQFIAGDDLAARLEKRGSPFPVSEVVEWADQLLDALDYLHLHDPPIVHRDIKPLNIKLGRRSEAILLDFGLAKGTLGQMSTFKGGASVFGFSPVYAPLEQIHGVGTDPRSDLYSLGATLYHLVTGVPPVDAPSRYNSLEEGGIDPLRPAYKLNSEVTEHLSNAVAKAMAISRKDRWGSATEMRNGLHDGMAHQPSSATRRSVARTPTFESSNEMGTRERIVYFNNCHNKDHARIYGPGAFYDLYTSGFQSGLARDLHPGQRCVVATLGNNNDIVFSWYSFLREEIKKDDTGTPCRVFFGEFLKSEKYSKAEAATKQPYAAFFDINGNFKRHSVHSVIEGADGLVVTRADRKSRARSITTEEEFFAELQKKSPAEASVAKRILEWSSEKFSRVNWRHSSFVPVLDYGSDFSHNPITVYAVGKVPRVGIKFGRMKRRNHLTEETRIELLWRLNDIRGVRLPSDSIEKYPNIRLSTLATGDALDKFLSAIAWTNEQVKAARNKDSKP